MAIHLNSLQKPPLVLRSMRGQELVSPSARKTIRAREDSGQTTCSQQKRTSIVQTQHSPVTPLHNQQHKAVSHDPSSIMAQKPVFKPQLPNQPQTKPRLKPQINHPQFTPSNISLDSHPKIKVVGGKTKNANPSHKQLTLHSFLSLLMPPAWSESKQNDTWGHTKDEIDTSKVF